jgi:hypothetical protein
MTKSRADSGTVDCRMRFSSSLPLYEYGIDSIVRRVEEETEYQMQNTMTLAIVVDYSTVETRGINEGVLSRRHGKRLKDPMERGFYLCSNVVGVFVAGESSSER